MIDLHCHILPGLDDGAQTLTDSMALLRAEKSQGIESIVFTPHFHPERISLESFLNARADSYSRLTSAEGFSELNLETKLGAEVFFSMRLIEMDVTELCFENTRYLLLELPVSMKPYGMKHTLKQLIGRGIIPILAHVERYGYFTQDPVQLYDLVMSGCLAQVNAAAVLRTTGNKGVSALQYIRWELAQLIGSDAHSVKERPPNTRAAYRYIEDKLGESYAAWLLRNSQAVFRNSCFDPPVIQKPRRFLGRWR